MKILILCTGNSCRSQMAQAFLQSFDKNIEVRSAGTKPANKVNAKAAAAMKEVGLDISGNTPRNVSEYLNENWDYVITVCGGANETCPMFLGKVKTRLHMGFEDPSEAKGSKSFITSEFARIRDAIKSAFWEFYAVNIRGKSER